MTYEEQYLTMLDRILTEGEWIYNRRTGERCLTLFGQAFEYTLEDPPLLTVRQSYPVSAIAEIIGYLRGYDNALQFANIGSSTWFQNSNENEQWLDNPYRKGDGDIGKAYGVVARDFGGVDTVVNVFEDLSKGIDNRGEIISFWKPDDFDKACLRPCMHTHNFNIIGENINLNSFQRSQDFLLGGNFNSLQCYFLLLLSSRISGKKFGKIKHDITNCHIYEDHLEGAKQLLKKKPLRPTAKLVIPDWINTYQDVIDSDKHAREYISVKDYYHLGKVDFKMAV